MITQLLAVTPIYLLANAHCLGMCGPIAFLIGKNSYAWLYFLGRIVAFGVAGTLAALLGEGLSQLFHRFQLPFLFSMFFGLILVYSGLHALGYRLGWEWKPLQRIFATLSQRFVQLTQSQRPIALFALGASTLLLPCGQSFSILALSAMMQPILLGTCNALLFALLTSPALLAAMQAHRFIKRMGSYQKILGILTICIGMIAMLRGMAVQGLIPHLSLALDSTPLGPLHFVIF